MSEFFTNLWIWLTTNLQYILSIVTSADFIMTGATVFTLFKNIKSTKSNTLSITSIKETIKTFNSMDEDVKNLDRGLKECASEIGGFSEKLSHISKSLEEFKEDCNTKINAMLEVQSIVYSTIKDDTIRTSVNSILINAKHSDTKSKVALQEEINNLKEQLENSVNSIGVAINDTLDKVSATSLGPINTEKHKEEFTRY